MRKIVERNSDGKNMQLDTSKDNAIFDLVTALNENDKPVGERFWTIYFHECKDKKKEYYILYQSHAQGDVDYINYPELAKIQRILTGNMELMESEQIEDFTEKGLILSEEDMQ